MYTAICSAAVRLLDLNNPRHHFPIDVMIRGRRLVPTLPNQAASRVVPTLPVVQVNVSLLGVAATNTAVR